MRKKLIIILAALLFIGAAGITVYPIKTLQENLGHATAAFTLEVYGHVSKQMQINSANKLESFIQNTFSDAEPARLVVGL